MISTCSMATGLSLLQLPWAASDGRPMCVLGSAEAPNENLTVNTQVQSIKGEC